MSELRILLPSVVPNAPGTLESLTITLRGQSDRVLEPILKFTLEKWTSLYDIRVLSYSISEVFVVLLAFVPAEALGVNEARERCEAFDRAQMERRVRLGASCKNYRRHRWPGLKLRDLSHFMGVFTHDLGLLHRYVPDELRNQCTESRSLLFQGRFKGRTVSHEAVPRIEGWMSREDLRETCSELGFKTPAGIIELDEMSVSDCAFGRAEFVEAVVDARNRVLQEKGRAPKYVGRLTKDGRADLRCLRAATPVNAAAFMQRASELAAVPGGWKSPELVKMVHDTVHQVGGNLGRSVSWGLQDMLVHRVTTRSATRPHSIPVWIFAMLMDGMIRVYYWRSMRKWEAEMREAQEQRERECVFT